VKDPVGLLERDLNDVVRPGVDRDVAVCVDSCLAACDHRERGLALLDPLFGERPGKVVLPMGRGVRRAIGSAVVRDRCRGGRLHGSECQRRTGHFTTAELVSFLILGFLPKRRKWSARAVCPADRRAEGDEVARHVGVSQP
jgi:hypothetical protein